MKLIHWIEVPDPLAISGMYSSLRELIEAEIAVLGIQNVGVCDVHEKEGGKLYQLNNSTIVTLPWDPTLKDPDAIHVIHTYSPLSMYDMKKKVFLAHGTPDYCWWDDVYKLGPPTWWQITTLVKICDATAVWFKRDSEFWEELTDKPVKVLRRGIDLKFWSMTGNRQEMYGQRPYLLYADALRMMKQPFTLLFSAKKVQRLYHNTYLKLLFGDPPRDIAWSNLVTRLGIEHFTPISLGLMPDPRDLYRSVDIGISPVMWGLLSRVPMELMASGTSVICYKGVDDNPIYGARVDDSPEALAAGIIKVWQRIEADPYGERLKARKTAEKNYDIANSAKDLIKVCEEVM